jgi:aminopeptidase N
MGRAVLAAVCVLAACSTAGSPVGFGGAAGAGDPYFPLQGNGGYDAISYSIQLRYDPARQRLSGVTTITARTTEPLARFDLDLRDWLKASSVMVNGVTAAHTASRGQELVITPARPLAARARFTVVVRYTGPARHLVQSRIKTGFITTDDGAFVGNEPDGAPTWFPVNDTPRDKATYTVAITVPRAVVAVSNGDLLGVRSAGADRTWSWRLTKPVPSYLITATIGRFGITRGRTPAGIPYLIAVDPRQARAAAPALRALPAIVDYFSSVYGAYPFETTGAIVDDAYVGYALETASRPLFDRAPDQPTLAHELAHQWFGDDVTLARWRDIWLNEGFAEFSTWLWDEHRGRMSAAQHLRRLLQQPASNTFLWDPPPGNPGSASGVFSFSVYERGAGTLQALRERVGDRTFFRILRGWVRAHRFGSATVPEFTRYASSVSRRDLTHFFDVWLYGSGKPANW